MENKKVIIALDLGTTGNRAIAFSQQGEIVAQAYKKFTQHYPEPGKVEHDPVELYSTAEQVLKEVIARVRIKSVKAIGITNQRETTIVWSRSTGKPLCNAIVWQDRRTTGMCRKLGKYKALIKKKTGLFIDPYFSATKIAWILDKYDPDRKKSRSGELMFGTPDTWVLWNLTERAVHATDSSNASRTMLYNIKELKWDRELLEIANIPHKILPMVQNSDSLFGGVVKKIGGKEIPVCGILGDQQASLFGQLGWDNRKVKSTYGTGIFILRNTENEIMNSNKLISTIAWKTKAGVNYAVEGSLFMGGASVQWLQENLAIIKNPKTTARAAQKVESNEGVYFVPAFQGLGAPYWDPNARALIIGLSRKANRNTIIRAALESMAYQVRDVIEAFGNKSQKFIDTLWVDGGATNNDFIMQFQADLLGVQVIKPEITETTALGAAGMAGISCGFWDNKSFSEIININKTYLPSENRKQFDSYYSGWKQAVKRSLDWNI